MTVTTALSSTFAVNPGETLSPNTYTDVPFDEIVGTFTAHYSEEWLSGAGGEF